MVNELFVIFGTASASLVVMLAILAAYARWLHNDAKRRVEEWLKGV